jgi:hypothetical protein
MRNNSRKESNSGTGENPASRLPARENRVILNFGEEKLSLP